MINYINGDLFSTKDKIILHGCNTLGKMGAGVALQMRQKYPKVYRDYKKAKLKLGNVVWSDTGENLIVGNCLIQETIGHSGTHINYIALRDCMKQAQILVSKLGITSISMPMIGSGLAGGSWTEISTIIYNEMPDIKINVWIYEN